MRLTKKKAIDISIELWEWLAETGEEIKLKWPSWEEYGEMQSDCALCEYDFRHNDDCSFCPYFKRFGDCCEGVYIDWCDATKKTERIKYARLFLEQLKELR